MSEDQSNETSNAAMSKERRVLMAMRKTLAAVVRDVTPSSSALKSPLKAETVEDIKMCFNLISAREFELAKEEGREPTERPRFIDEPKTTNVVSLDALTANLKNRKKETPSDE